MENEGSSVGPPHAAEPLAPSLAASDEKSRRYFSRRFTAVYVVLGIILVGSIAAFVVFALRPTISPTAAWSSWRPSGGGGTAKVAKEIADHVAPEYHLAKGSQLVAVVPSPPAVTAGTQNVAINAVAVHSAATGNTDVTQLEPGKTEMYSFCGLGTHCSIATGQPSQTRGQLVRREALETALDTFKYISPIDSVIVFMPPNKNIPNQTTVLFFQRQNLADRLKQPLKTTLPLSKPPLPDELNRAEGPTIDALTLPSLYVSNLTQLQSGGALLILTPAT